VPVSKLIFDRMGDLVAGREPGSQGCVAAT